MPILAAISGIGRSRALRAIWRSVGKVTAIAILLSSGQQAGQCLLAPLFRRLDLVEREHVQPHHLAVSGRQLRKEAGDEALRAVAAGLERAQEPVGMSLQETRRVDDPDLGRYAEQLRRVGDARQADADRQLNTPLS